jgi:hypothetical protein
MVALEDSAMRGVSLSPRAVVTKCHRLSGYHTTEIHCFTVLEAESWNSRCHTLFSL